MAQVYRSGRPYGIGQPTRLTSHEVRTRTFATRRRGLDPDEVRAFQAELADDLAAFQREAATLGRENERLRRALRDWQAMHARRCDPEERSRGNAGHW